MLEGFRLIRLAKESRVGHVLHRDSSPGPLRGSECKAGDSPHADRVHLDIAFVEEDEINLFPIGLEYPQREPVTPECS
jgi:hypothetical protein